MIRNSSRRFLRTSALTQVDAVIPVPNGSPSAVEGSCPWFWAVTRFNLAMIYRGQGELGRAVAELEQVVELDRQVQHPDLASDILMLERVRQEHAEAESRT